MKYDSKTGLIMHLTDLLGKDKAMAWHMYQVLKTAERIHSEDDGYTLEDISKVEWDKHLETATNLYNLDQEEDDNKFWNK